MIIARKLKKALVFPLLFFWSLSFPCQAQTGNLVLQWEASHPTGERQVTLIFKPDRVDLFTNTSLWQDLFLPRLGHFTSVLNEEWEIERDRINIYQSLLTEYLPVDVDRLIERENFPSIIADLIQESPHAPVLRLNEHAIKEGNPYFSVLEDVFHSLWRREEQWTCVDCVTYRIHRKGIERSGISKDGIATKEVLSRKKLNCRSVSKKFLECIDTYGGPAGNGYGNFRINL